MTKTTLATWLKGARLRTLPLALAPIAAGTGVVATEAEIQWLLVALATAVALLLQVGVNFANDYSDGIRGTDDQRVGPLRLTASGSATPAAVKTAAFACFALAAVAGLAIVVLTEQWWLLAVGALAILAAWFYTGGKSPYGYAGLGELAVFVFFGLVATVGTSFIQTLTIQPLAVILGAAVGSYASAVLMVNNVRDIDTDREVGKRTLAVILGKRYSRVVFLLMIWAPMSLILLLVNVWPATFVGWASLLLVIPITVIVATAKKPEEYNLVLKLTSFAGLSFGLLMGLGLAVVNFAL
jgi:1,4-dihydroxy-2-naphthoate polyprenyltransferase